jgi:hypothetical protein
MLDLGDDVSDAFASVACAPLANLLIFALLSRGMELGNVATRNCTIAASGPSAWYGSTGTVAPLKLDYRRPV